MSEDKREISRRDFLKAVVAGAGACYVAAIAYPVFRYLMSPAEEAKTLAAVTEVMLKDAQKLSLGGSMMFKFGARPAILIHHKDDSWVAMDAVCTHLGCTVQYLSDKSVIHCNCHGGEYDAKSGKNISGPPPRPLRAYVVKIVEDGVLVSRA